MEDGITRPQPTGIPGPVRFPPGETVLDRLPFDEGLFRRVDELLAGGRVGEGRLEIETVDARLTCLIHRGRPFLAGLLEGEVFSRVPLAEFPLRATQLTGGLCSLVEVDVAMVMMAAVHFCKRPMLQASTRLVDPAHVLSVVAADARDAAIAFERSGARTLLFLHEGKPARVYFGDPRAAVGEGSVADRFLLYAFDPEAPTGRLEVFTELKIPHDPAEGTELAELAEAAKPPPPVSVVVRLKEGREVLDRAFAPPSMIIGRDPRTDIFLDNLAVSRRHARLSWERGRFLIEDLESANGTRVNGRPVQREPIEPGDRIGIGKFVIGLEEVPETMDFSETMLISTRTGMMPVFLDSGGQQIPLDGSVVIGKGRGVDAAAKGLFVRRAHARIDRRGPGVYRLSCFGSASVEVNGKKVSEAQLAVGDEIVVGKTRYKVKTAG